MSIVFGLFVALQAGPTGDLGPVRVAGLAFLVLFGLNFVVSVVRVRAFLYTTVLKAGADARERPQSPRRAT
jgi:hypothetical protein